MGDLVTITPTRGVDDSVRSRLRSARPLLRLWIGRDLRARYRHSTLRASWSIVQPLALLLTYGWVFVFVLDVPQEDIPYLSFAWAGLAVFGLVQQALGAGTGSIVDSAGVVSKVYFPREVIPLSVVGVAVVDLATTLGILVVLAWVQIGPPSIHLVGAILPLAMITVWVAAVTTLAATGNVFRRDVRQVMPLVLRVLFIVSPVMYSASSFGPVMARVSELNPIAVAIEGVRDTVLREQWPDLLPLAAHLVAAGALLALSLVLVGRVERTMADHV